MPSQPSSFLNWVPSGSGSYIVQPPTSLQATGWMAGQAPPFQYMNWLFYITDQWIQYFAALNSGASPLPNLKFLSSGTFNYVNSTGVLTWAGNINIEVAGLPDSYNQLAAGNVTLTDGEVGYVSLNLPVVAVGNTTTSSTQITGLSTIEGIQNGMQIIGSGITGGTTVVSASGTTVVMSAGASSGVSGGTIVFAFNTALTITAVANSSFFPTSTQFAIFRRIGSVVYIGINTNVMILRDGETKLFLQDGYQSIFTGTAGANLTAGQPVYIATSADTGRTAGDIYPVDAGATHGATRSLFAGIVMTSVSSAATVSVIASGITITTGLTAGTLYYADPATPGNITSTKPSSTGQYVVPIGIAVSSTELLVDAPGSAGSIAAIAAPLSYIAPTITPLTSNGTAAGYLFRTSSANATVGATYTNNGNTFTVLDTISAGLFLAVSGTGTLSGTTLTKASGTGDSTITFTTGVTQALTAITSSTLAPSGTPLYYKVTTVAGGGGGSGTANNPANPGGGGGGAGGVSIKWIPATTFGTTRYYCVGAAGAGGAGSSSGGFGGMSALETLCLATGGTGGIAGIGTNGQVAYGGWGGNSTQGQGVGLGDLVLGGGAGSCGGPGIPSVAAGNGGAGGSNGWGGGGIGTSNTEGTNIPSTGINYGGGGGGGAGGNNAGVAGAQGLVLIEAYYQ
jgi:hypothetical protein